MGDDDDGKNYERFDVDNDYEGGQWVGDEYFYSRKRAKRQQTRDEQLYGYQSDDSDGETRRAKRRERVPANYTKPVGFVSSGVVTSSDDKPQDVERAEHRAEQGAEARAGLGASAPGAGLGSAGAPAPADARAGLGAAGGAGTGIGFGGGGGASGGGGLGFRAASDAAPAALDGGDADEDEVVLPTEFGRMLKQKAAEKLSAQRSKQHKEKQRTSTLKSDPDIATFEKHTKGFGMKMMQAMGYKPGEGLGREKQGIAKPIDARMRPKGMGMGFNDYEEHKLLRPNEAAQLAAKPDGGSDAKEQARGSAQDCGGAVAASEAKLWRRRNAVARERRAFRTASEVLAEAPEAAAAPKQAILDLRGPQART